MFHTARAVASGCPAFTTCVLNPTSVTPPASGSTNSILTVTTNVGGTTPTGTNSLIISGNAGVHTTTVSLTVNAAPIQDFSMSRNPTSLTLTQGASGNSTVTVTSLNGFSSLVGLTVSGCPTTGGATCSLSPTSMAPPANSTATSTLHVTIGPSTTATTYTLTITGTSGVIHTVPVRLVVNGRCTNGNCQD